MPARVLVPPWCWLERKVQGSAKVGGWCAKILVILVEVILVVGRGNFVRNGVWWPVTTTTASLTVFRLFRLLARSTLDNP